jgi:endonuclease I
MKKYLLLILVAQFSFGQIPTGYYNTATGTGYTLKTNLKKIINDANDGLTPEYQHIDRGYGSGSSQTNNGLWSAYGTTDIDNGIGYDNDNTIVDIYTEIPSGADVHNFNFNTELGANEGQCGSIGSPNYVVEGDCYNREHLIPKSYFGDFQPMYSDVQHVYPTDGKVNGIHDNFAFGKVNVASYTSSNGSKLGSATNSGYAAGFSGTVFEPIDEFKGDVARVYLYFATRYEDQMAGFYATYTGVDCRVMFDGSSNQVFSPTFLNILLTWHNQDPVSTKEIVRNNASFTHQNNRNPYIDHPEYVTTIWGSPLNSESFLADNAVSIYPNPTNTNEVEIFTTESITKLTLVNVNGQIIKDIENPIFNQNTYKLNNLPQGFYFLQISAENGSLTKKIIVN